MSLEDSINNFDPGYKPIKLEYKEGHFWLQNGVRFEPDFELINEPKRIALFIEYERTFGRGKAFEITHKTTEESRRPEVIKKYNGQDIISVFERFSYIVPMVTMGGGDSALIEKLMLQLKNFRNEHTLLYEDAEDHQEPGHDY